jgi:hypoxanthine-guanine phosphoribosyltransferase
VDDQFLVGYGLDFQGHFRSLPCIAALEEVPKSSRVA